MNSNVTKRQLNKIISDLQVSLSIDGSPDKVKTWVTVNMGEIETHVGDKKYIISFVDKLQPTVEKAEMQGIAIEEIITKYMVEEGFVGDEYAYIGMQLFDSTNIIDDEE